MYQLIIVPNNANAAASIYYKNKEDAQAALKKSHAGGNIYLDDDFGNEIRLPADNFSYSMLMDLEKNPLIQFERELATKTANDIITHDPRYQDIVGSQVNQGANQNRNGLIRGQ